MKVNAQRLIRKVHYWSSLAIALSGVLVAVTGAILLLKKDVDALQPPTQPASSTAISPTRLTEIHEAAVKAGGDGFSWTNLDRIDVRPSDGVAKVVNRDFEEVQVDIHTLEPLGFGYRGADLVEKIHDTSFFHPLAKYLVALPTAFVLIVMWATGLWLFGLPLWIRFRNHLARP